MTDIDALIAEARRNAAWRDERHRCITDPALLRGLSDALTAERAKVAALEAEVKIAEAKGWRDAVTCVQYSKANWSQDCRSAEERKALENAARELVNQLVAASPGDWLGAEWKTAQDYSDTIAKLEAEVERLNKALTYEEHRSGRQGTHGPGCHEWGPQHYECLKAEATRWREVAGELAGAMQKAEPHLDAIICYASTMDEHEPNRIAHDFRAALTCFKQESDHDQ